jgi:hypothetical protein
MKITYERFFIVCPFKDKQHGSKVWQIYPALYHFVIQRYAAQRLDYKWTKSKIV